MPDADDDWELPDPGALADPGGTRRTGRAGPAGQSAAARVLAERQDELMQRPGVTMVGESIDAAGKSAILIGVRTSADLAALPREVEGVPVIGTVTGEVDALRRPQG